MKLLEKIRKGDRRIIRLLGVKVYEYAREKSEERVLKDKNDYLLQKKIEQKSQTSTDSGISDSGLDVVISLTTYGERLNTVYITIETLFSQTLKPKRVMLWLDEKEFSEERLPQELKQLQKRGLEIYFCKNTRSYKKLVPTLTMLKDSHIITVDDDVMYPSNWLEEFRCYEEKYPQTVLCFRGVKIAVDGPEKTKPYRKWTLVRGGQPPSFDIMPTGVSGVLYPAGCFSEEVLDERTFMELCPTADDIWFKAMTLKAGYKSYVIPSLPEMNQLPPFIEHTQDDCLTDINRETENNRQFDNVFSKYNLWDML